MTHRAARWFAFPRVPTLDRSVLDWNSPMVCRRCQSCWQGSLACRPFRRHQAGNARICCYNTSLRSVSPARWGRGDGGGITDSGGRVRCIRFARTTRRSRCGCKQAGGAPAVLATLRLISRPIDNLTEIGDTYGSFDTTRTWCSERTRT